MARFAGAHEPATPDEGSLTLSSAVSTVTYPVRYASHMLYEAVPFTNKGATVLLKVPCARRAAAVYGAAAVRGARRGAPRGARVRGT